LEPDVDLAWGYENGTKDVDELGVVSVSYCDHVHATGFLVGAGGEIETCASWESPTGVVLAGVSGVEAMG